MSSGCNIGVQVLQHEENLRYVTPLLTKFAVKIFSDSTLFNANISYTNTLKRGQKKCKFPFLILSHLLTARIGLRNWTFCFIVLQIPVCDTLLKCTHVHKADKSSLSYLGFCS